MIIQGTGYGDNVIRNVEGKKISREIPEKPYKTGDAVKISGTVQGFKHADKTSYTVEPEYSPRIERVRTASRRVAQGEYNDKQLDSVAEKIAASPALKDVIGSEALQRVDNQGESAERIKTAQEHVNESYYDNPQVLKEIALRLINALNI